jgi:hypothetical protein
MLAQEGISKMKRNHIHLAQGVAGDNVVSGKLCFWVHVITRSSNHYIRHAAVFENLDIYRRSEGYIGWDYIFPIGKRSRTD